MNIVKSDQYETENQAAFPDASQGEVVVFPASFAQRRFWFLDRLMPGGWAFNLPAAYRIRGALDIPALEKTFSEIVCRHEILRTTFKEINGEPSQIISDPQPVRLPVIDLRVLEPAQREARVQSHIESEFGVAFNLSTGPLMTITLLKTGDDEHVLIKNMHHIITDLWSEEIFLAEWVSLYQSFSQNKPASLDPLPIQYADFSEWQRQSLQGEVVEREAAYWRKKLGGGIEPLSLPTDHVRGADTNLSGAVVKFSIQRQTADALRILSRREGTTLFVTLLAAFKILLYRYTGHTDMAVSTPITNRNRAELEKLIGFFLNTLVLRTDLGGGPGFLEVLARVRETTLGAFEHQNLPFEVVVEKLQPARDLTQHPFSQAMFIMLPEMKSVWKAGGTTVEAMEVGRNSMEQDIILSLYDKGDAIEGLFTYSVALFDRQTIEHMARHFQVLVESIAANPACPIDDLQIIDDAERAQLLVNWNDTAAPCSLTPVPGLIAAQCARTPAATAIEFAGRKMSYAELLDRSQRLAAHLQKLGARPGQLVGVCVGRSPEMIVSVLGILMTGAAYVPLDPQFPSARLGQMIADAAPLIIVTQRNTEAALPENSAQRVHIENELSLAPEFRAPEISPESIAYVLFTSGSTGRPKGVEVPHRALTNLLESMLKTPGLSSADTLLAVTTLSFDIAGLEIFLPLICGAKVLLASRENAQDPRALAAMIAKSNVSVMQATPATWRGMLAAGWEGSQKLKILCGGEAMTRDLASALLTRCSSLWNVYGPTETTIWSTV
ncbi:MAG TPA: condensation domain-containing protein, partial [Chthoniobacteraceae bacterium]|nr:condensation domain-containing protein [Chthoniobacteraceae bacterium]